MKTNIEVKHREIMGNYRECGKGKYRTKYPMQKVVRNFKNKWMKKRH